ncbi:DNA/RNA helicase domain-containing protein [Streptomyces sp. NPDC055692]|uniref:DNA/RNA helicase domain-containing protein n=1 Tax=Streptomyces sp. NPDC055692 TaxID=3155683 RepID=UPI00343E8DAA
MSQPGRLVVLLLTALRLTSRLPLHPGVRGRRARACAGVQDSTAQEERGNAQSLEYHHADVIIGPGLTWRNGHWHVHPDHSRDANLRHLTPTQYLPYALNTYRVLFTRGTHTTRIHTTDPHTHHMLQQLIHPR